METEYYFVCPTCGKKILKRKGIKVIGGILCVKCFDKLKEERE